MMPEGFSLAEYNDGEVLNEKEEYEAAVGFDAIADLIDANL